MKFSHIWWSETHKKTTKGQMIINGLVVYLLLAGFFWLSLSAVNITLDFSFFGDFQVRVWDGFKMTLALSCASLVLSFLLGSLTAWGQGSSFLPWRYLCTAYVTFIRGTPLIMQIYLFFYILGTAWGIENRFLAGVLILAVFEGAYIAEIIRGSISSLDNVQEEAARSVGFTPYQSWRYVLIPQLLSRTLPALTGQFASIIKDSSLLSMIAVIELTQTMREISAVNFRLFECYFVLGLLYLALTFPVTLLSKWLERKYDYAA